MGDICIQNLRVSFNGSPNKFVVNNISLTLKSLANKFMFEKNTFA